MRKIVEFKRTCFSYCTRVFVSRRCPIFKTRSMTDCEVNSPTQINELTWLLTAQHSTMILETPNSIVHTVLTLHFCRSKGASEIGFRLRCHSRVALPLDLPLRCALYPPPVLKWTLLDSTCLQQSLGSHLCEDLSRVLCGA